MLLLRVRLTDRAIGLTTARCLSEVLGAGINVWIIQLAPAWTVSVLQCRNTNVCIIPCH